MKGDVNKILIISDLHLSETCVALTQAFYAFLENTAKHAKHLIILGDFFEIWLGDDMADAHARAVAEKLKALSNLGVQISFIAGNRDFSLGHEYAALCGMRRLPEFYLLENEILLCHGDQLCTLDLRYQKWRNFIRNPLILWFLGHSPKWLRAKIGKTARVKSLAIKQKFTQKIGEDAQLLTQSQKKDLEKYDVTESAVTAALQKYRAKIMIHGHVHKALNSDRRYVLRDWDQEYDYLSIDMTTRPWQIKRHVVEIKPVI